MEGLCENSSKGKSIDHEVSVSASWFSRWDVVVQAKYLRFILERFLNAAIFEHEAVANNENVGQNLLNDKFKRRNTIPSEQRPINYATKPRQMLPCNNINNFQMSTGTASASNPSEIQPSTNPGMKDLYNWLKFLRLHKYYNQLVRLTYEELLSLNEENFDQLVPGVTQGARRKFLLTIDGLRERYKTLVSIRVNAMAMSSEALLQAMDQLKLMIFTPIKAASPESEMKEDDLPSHFYMVLNTIFSRLISNNLKEEECVKRLRSLIYFTMKNEAFSKFTNLLSSMKNRLFAIDNPSTNSSMCLRQPPRPIQSSHQYLSLGGNKGYQPRATSSMTHFAFERVNNPQFDSKRVEDIPDEHTRESIPGISLAVGSGRTMSQRNSITHDSASKSPDQIISRNNSFNYNELLSNLDCAFKPCFTPDEAVSNMDRAFKPSSIPESNVTMDVFSQRVSGLSLNGESVNEYRLFLQDHDVVEENNNNGVDKNNNW